MKKEVPQDITLEEYCKHYSEYAFIGYDAIMSLHNQLMSRLSEKDTKDFYKYIYRNGKKMRKPSVWVKIYKCLPLLSLYTYSDNNECKRLYNKLRKGDTSVLELTL